MGKASTDLFILIIKHRNINFLFSSSWAGLTWSHEAARIVGICRYYCVAVGFLLLKKKRGRIVSENQLSLLPLPIK